jgi:hypothetical protein
MRLFYRLKIGAPDEGPMKILMNILQRLMKKYQRAQLRAKKFVEKEFLEDI